MLMLPKIWPRRHFLRHGDIRKNCTIREDTHNGSQLSRTMYADVGYETRVEKRPDLCRSMMVGIVQLQTSQIPWRMRPILNLNWSATSLQICSIRQWPSCLKRHVPS